MSYHDCTACAASRPMYLQAIDSRCTCLDYGTTGTFPVRRRVWRAADGVVVTCRQEQHGGPVTVDGDWSTYADGPNPWPRDVDGRTMRMFWTGWDDAMIFARRLVAAAEEAN